MCDNSGYSADESDTEYVSQWQQKCSRKQKKIQEKHRCDSDTDLSENCPLYKNHSAAEANHRGIGGKLNTQQCEKQRPTPIKDSTQPKVSTVEKMPVTFSYTSPAHAFKSLAIVHGRNVVVTKPRGGFVLPQQTLQYTANEQMCKHPHHSVHQHQLKPLCTVQSGHAETTINNAKLGSVSVTKQFKVHADCAGTARQQKLIATQGVKENMYSEETKAWRSRVYNAAELLHAGYYPQMLQVLEHGHTPPSLHTDIFLSVVFGCGLAYHKMTKYQPAIEHLTQLQQMAAKCGSNGNQALAYMYLGDIASSRAEYTNSIKFYGMALQLYDTHCVAREYRLVLSTPAALHMKLASCHRKDSKMFDAVQSYKTALLVSTNMRDKLSAHTSLGNLYQSLGENTSAVEEYEKSVQVAEELNDMVTLGWAHGNIGNAYLGLHQRDKALHHLQLSLELAIQHEQTPQAIGRVYNNLGTAFQALSELDKAQEYYDLSLSQAIYGNDLYGQARVYGNIGNLLMLHKQFERAVPHYTEVLRLSRESSTTVTAYHNRGCAYYEWGENKKKALVSSVKSSVTIIFYIHGIELPQSEQEHLPPALTHSITKYYKQGTLDLLEVVKHHESTLETIKGSSKGLSLSVSLFETNSRTFHRLQDCYVNLGDKNWLQALVRAEQCRARTLGEMMLIKKHWALKQPLHAPLDLQQIQSIVMNQGAPVLYLSYTGARLLLWLLLPQDDALSMSMIEVPLEDDQFEGKSFDYHMRYQLSEEMVEKSLEMYKPFDYKDISNKPVETLHDIIGQPMKKLLYLVQGKCPSSSCTQDIVVIPDSYTNLLPMTCLIDRANRGFLGDKYIFRIMPSLLTMGILDQLPPVTVTVPIDGNNMCIVGNPTIPIFNYKGETWNLGKLPYAKKEAEAIAHILNASPILHEQATKSAVSMRMMNAKVIHLATHGSAAAGFLALAGMPSSHSEHTDESRNILLYPDEVETLALSPALVVLSSCDSGRGTLKADGIQGMARAFLLAGAQAVLTTLWRVPDESAYVFMEFFYQYLVDGFKASHALHKATLSLRCFSKYSQYIHWSGYQLTGREVQFQRSCHHSSVQDQIGPSSIFPRLEILMKLKTLLVTDPRQPTDVQVRTKFSIFLFLFVPY